jgi:hypothetical protein
METAREAAMRIEQRKGPLGLRVALARGGTAAALSLHVAVAPVLAQGSPSAPLFASEAPIAITLAADFSLLEGDRDDEAPERPATVTLEDGTALEAQLRTRGNFRREKANCFMPPLRINLRTGQLGGTAFEGQDKLKIVGNCRPGRRSYEVLVLREYLAYRALQAITDEAFRVRLAHITYVDESGAADPRTEYAFFIEDDEQLAARLGARVFGLDEGRNLLPQAFAVVPATRLAIFQYMIGNTDWSDMAEHNVLLLQRGAGAVAIPYDFDFSGLVGAPYATPAPDIGLDDVRERRYLGWCRPPGVAEAVLGEVQAARDEIIAVVEGFDGLDEGERQSMLDYLTPFFDSIQTPERARATFLGLCRRLPGN